MTQKKAGISIAVKNKLDPESLKPPKPKIYGEQVLNKIEEVKQKLAH